MSSRGIELGTPLASDIEAILYTTAPPVFGIFLLKANRLTGVLFTLTGVLFRLTGVLFSLR